MLTSRGLAYRHARSTSEQQSELLNFCHANGGVQADSPQDPESCASNSMRSPEGNIPGRAAVRKRRDPRPLAPRGFASLRMGLSPDTPHTSGATMLNLRNLFLAVGLCMAGSATAVRPAAAQTTITCESQKNAFRDCRIVTGGKVRLVQNISNTRCEYGRTWGFDWNSIWVDRGCRGKFQVNGSGTGWESGNYGQRVTCESQNELLRSATSPRSDTCGWCSRSRSLAALPAGPGVTRRTRSGWRMAVARSSRWATATRTGRATTAS